MTAARPPLDADGKVLLLGQEGAYAAAENRYAASDTVESRARCVSLVASRRNPPGVTGP